MQGGENLAVAAQLRVATPVLVLTVTTSLLRRLPLLLPCKLPLLLPCKLQKPRLDVHFGSVHPRGNNAPLRASTPVLRKDLVMDGLEGLVLRQSPRSRLLPLRSLRRRLMLLQVLGRAHRGSDDLSPVGLRRHVWAKVEARVEARRGFGA